MDAKRLHRLVVVLLPIVYLVHNLEEWIELKANANIIIENLPASIGLGLPNDPSILVSVFGIAVIVATIIPTVVSIYLWRRNSKLGDSILVIIGFATLFNVLSHVTTTLFVQFRSPGLISAIALCVPYIIGIAIYSLKFSKINILRMVVLGIISVPVYLGAIILSWLMAYMIYL